jgi:hypothetical protein
MNRRKKSFRDTAFYTPADGHPGVGLIDAYGSVYMTRKDGSIKRIERKKHCTKNKR